MEAELRSHKLPGASWPRVPSGPVRTPGGWQLLSGPRYLYFASSDAAALAHSRLLSWMQALLKALSAAASRGDGPRGCDRIRAKARGAAGNHRIVR